MHQAPRPEGLYRQTAGGGGDGGAQRAHGQQNYNNEFITRAFWQNAKSECPLYKLIVIILLPARLLPARYLSVEAFRQETSFKA